jgi:hypothetical protein
LTHVCPSDCRRYSSWVFNVSRSSLPGRKKPSLVDVLYARCEAEARLASFEIAMVRIMQTICRCLVTSYSVKLHVAMCANKSRRMLWNSQPFLARGTV